MAQQGKPIDVATNMTQQGKHIDVATNMAQQGKHIDVATNMAQQGKHSHVIFWVYHLGFEKFWFFVLIIWIQLQRVGRSSQTLNG